MKKIETNQLTNPETYEDYNDPANYLGKVVLLVIGHYFKMGSQTNS